MGDKLRQLAQRVKDRVQLVQAHVQGREKVDQLLQKYVPPGKVTEIAEKFKQKTFGKKFKEVVGAYEKFTGVQEIMAIQNTVIGAQVSLLSLESRKTRN